MKGKLLIVGFWVGVLDEFMTRASFEKYRVYLHCQPTYCREGILGALQPCYTVKLPGQAQRLNIVDHQADAITTAAGTSHASLAQ